MGRIERHGWCDTEMELIAKAAVGALPPTGANVMLLMFCCVFDILISNVCVNLLIM